ncbi:MAG: P-II family nitrogen regulator [Deltaproteobacteria bacterium]|nr:P-II family nitrogen regulator [Deltaproteobacteria bacterium]
MKKVEAIINLFKLGDVKKVLNDMGIYEISTSRINGHGRQKGHKEIHRGAKYIVDFIPKVRLEVIVNPNLVNLIIEKIRNTAYTGKIGDGKIFISSVE